MIEYLLPPAMAILNRWRGHASDYKKYLPRPWSQLILSLPFGYIAYKYGDTSLIIPVLELIYAPDWIKPEYALSAIMTILTWLFWLSGWGNGHDMGTRPRGKPETLEWPVLWLHGRIPEYWYDFIFLAWRGACITIPTGLVTGNIAFAVSGASMVVAYAIGHIIYPNGAGKGIPHMDEATAIGEFLLGLFVGIAFVIFF
jgi:hypothetical protein